MPTGQLTRDGLNDECTDCRIRRCSEPNQILAAAAPHHAGPPCPGKRGKPAVGTPLPGEFPSREQVARLLQEYLDPPLQGHRLAGDAYERIEPDEAGCLESQELLLKLVVDAGSLRFYRQDTGERLPTRAERAEHEARARQAAEAEVARLREELARWPPLDAHSSNHLV
jgi:hypothetical protein